MKIGILTSGGDCPGINATIRGVCKTAINHYGMEVYGIHSGFRGLLDNDIVPLDESSLTGLLNLGGTILGTSREKPFKRKAGAVSENKPAIMLQTIRERGLDCIVCIGGNGTQKTAAKLAEAGVNVVSIPKTIDNDVWGTDVSFGFDSAVTIATDAIDRLHSTASATSVSWSLKSWATRLDGLPFTPVWREEATLFCFLKFLSTFTVSVTPSSTA